MASRTHFVFLLLRLRLSLLPSVIAIVVAERSISLLFAPDSTAAELLDVISVFLVQFGVFFSPSCVIYGPFRCGAFVFFCFCSFRELHGTN